MKIKFNVPSDLPKNGWISYDVKTMWRPDGKKIGEHLTLELEFRSEEHSVDECFSIFKEMLEINSNLIEVSIRVPVDSDEIVTLRFQKQGDFSEQDPETCEVKFLPDDPVEWLGEK
jgi:hypothetical protein